MVAIDPERHPPHSIAELRPLPPNVTLRDAAAAGIAELPAGSFDVVLALDVLEHVDDLDGTVAALCHALKPGGELLVSGPTENLLCRLGRRVAGRDYSGAYHVRDIDAIHAALAAHARVRRMATRSPLLPLFRTYVAQPVELRRAAGVAA